MTNKELIDILKTLKKCDVYSIRAKDGAKLPYLVVNYGGSQNFEADDTTFNIAQDITLELYTTNKNETVESEVEDLLVQNCLPYQKDEAFDDGQQFYIVYYSLIRR